MKKIKLGNIPKESDGRDAVHVAIIPIQAGGSLKPGYRIILNENKKAVVCPNHLTALGIVDPFFPRANIAKDSWFWLCLYPGTITSFRHEWEHPKFLKETKSRGQKELSERWLRGYIRTVCPDDPEGYLEFLNSVKFDKEIFYHGLDCHSLGDVINSEELFKHLSIVLEKTINADYFERFTCNF